MDRGNLLKFMLVAFALPLQFFISQYWSNDSIQQSEALRNLVHSMSDFKKNYLEFESWVDWYFSFVVEPHDFVRISKRKPVHYDDDIAVEVLNFRKSLTNFAESTITRSPRPSKVLFRVGQVIKHKKYDLYGVIIGWDERANAPEDWLNRNYGDEKYTLKNQPHYLILVDKKYQDKFTTKAYIVQEDIEIPSQHVKISHQTLRSYFSDFDRGQYLLKKFLKTVYPHD